VVEVFGARVLDVVAHFGGELRRIHQDVSTIGDERTFKRKIGGAADLTDAGHVAELFEKLVENSDARRGFYVFRKSDLHGQNLLSAEAGMLFKDAEEAAAEEGGADKEDQGHGELCGSKHATDSLFTVRRGRGFCSFGESAVGVFGDGTKR